MDNKYLNYLKKYNIIELSVFLVVHILDIKLKTKYYGFKYFIKSKIFNVKIGDENNIVGNIVFLKLPNSTIRIGNNFNSVNDYDISAFNFMPLTRFKTFSSTSEITIGNNVHINSSSILCNSTSIEIGNNVLIAPNCIITDSDFHGIAPNKRDEREPKKDKKIVIEDNVWIGMNSTIMKGVSIGRNSVVGAGSIVIKDIEPNSLYAGNPAKFIKKISNDM